MLSQLIGHQRWAKISVAITVERQVTWLRIEKLYHYIRGISLIMELIVRLIIASTKNSTSVARKGCEFQPTNRSRRTTKRHQAGCIQVCVWQGFGRH